ncbi:MAG: hypothetical protein WAU10_10215 [Caldilineaceae bacterium]
MAYIRGELSMVGSWQEPRRFGRYDIISSCHSPMDDTTRLELLHRGTMKRVITPPMSNFEQLFEYLESLTILEQ